MGCPGLELCFVSQTVTVPGIVTFTIVPPGASQWVPSAKLKLDPLKVLACTYSFASRSSRNAKMINGELASVPRIRLRCFHGHLADRLGVWQHSSLFAQVAHLYLVFDPSCKSKRHMIAESPTPLPPLRGLASVASTQSSRTR